MCPIYIPVIYNFCCFENQIRWPPRMWTCRMWKSWSKWEEPWMIRSWFAGSFSKEGYVSSTSYMHFYYHNLLLIFMWHSEFHTVIYKHWCWIEYNFIVSVGEAHCGRSVQNRECESRFHSVLSISSQDRHGKQCSGELSFLYNVSNTVQFLLLLPLLYVNIF